MPGADAPVDQDSASALPRRFGRQCAIGRPDARRWLTEPAALAGVLMLAGAAGALGWAGWRLPGALLGAALGGAACTTLILVIERVSRS